MESVYYKIPGFQRTLFYLFRFKTSKEPTIFAHLFIMKWDISDGRADIM